MPKLSDTQAILLSAAAARADRSILPPPTSLKLGGAALARSLKSLLDRGLIAENSTAAEAASNNAASEPVAGNSLIVTAAGLDAVGVKRSDRLANDAVGEQEAKLMREDPRPRGKLGVLLDAVSCPEGATLEEISVAAGWLPHTTRAAVSRLRGRGYDVRIATMGTRKAYRLLPAD